jgi:peptide/nickel transport system substrate-binding protein
MSGTSRRWPALLVGLLIVTAAAGACGGSSSGGSSDGTGPAADDTLNLAFPATDMSPDPATYYGGYANEVQTALYEALVQYAPDSATLVPQLADSWEVSPDGLTYTFHLRDGVTFHDGTTMDAESVKYSWQRTIDIAAAPSYMLASVADMQAPDPLTFVVTLSAPNESFLDYQASVYGPKVLSPTLVKANAGSDHGQTYLATHDAGTGPYTLAALNSGKDYQLAAYEQYWGDAPYYKKVKVDIIPEITSQILKFESGELDMLTYGLGIADIDRLAGIDGVSVTEHPVPYKTYVFVNPSRNNILSDVEIRKAMRQAIDRASIVDTVRGDTGTVSENFYPITELPDGLAPDKVDFDPSVLTGLLADTTLDKSITIGYLEGDAAESQAAELVQTQLQAAGADATAKAYTLSATLELSAQPDQQSDIYLWTTSGDTATPGSFAETFLMEGAPLNMVSASLPEADAAVVAGQSSVDASAADQYYAEAAKLWVDAGLYFTIADVKATIVAQPSAKTFVHPFIDVFGVNLASVRP